MTPEKTYAIADIFFTLQGEGPHMGMPCVFIRLAGCNSWDGQPETRAKSSCPFCDTDFRMREKLTRDQIIERVGTVANLSTAHMPIGIVLTGGEPLLQLDRELTRDVCELVDWVDVETNGSIPWKFPIRDYAWSANLTVICSPKNIPGFKLIPDHMNLVYVDVWKILIPDNEWAVAPVLEMVRTYGQFKVVYLHPTMPDGEPQDVQLKYLANVNHAASIVWRNPRFLRLGLQAHKVWALK